MVTVTACPRCHQPIPELAALHARVEADVRGDLPAVPGGRLGRLWRRQDDLVRLRELGFDERAARRATRRLRGSLVLLVGWCVLAAVWIVFAVLSTIGEL